MVPERWRARAVIPGAECAERELNCFSMMCSTHWMMEWRCTLGPEMRMMEDAALAREEEERGEEERGEEGGEEEG